MRRCSQVISVRQIIRFAQGDEEATIEELVDSLRREELKALAQRNFTGKSTMKVSINPNMWQSLHFI
jgi:hypothetical protein